MTQLDSKLADRSGAYRVWRRLGGNGVASSLSVRALTGCPGVIATDPPAGTIAVSIASISVAVALATVTIAVATAVTVAAPIAATVAATVAVATPISATVTVATPISATVTIATTIAAFRFGGLRLQNGTVRLPADPDRQQSKNGGLKTGGQQSAT
ncbi:hypothetical protein [Mesorhizobium liriopis]|uniref:hypothetical protein n=1 Tax=Mesorhizobium liriopis TaxID=2953882 RepID=UPI00338ED328